MKKSEKQHFLARLREGKGLSQRSLAGTSGVAQGAISEVEAGKRNLTPSMAAKFGAALGHSPLEMSLAAKVHEIQERGDSDAAFNMARKLSKVLPDTDATQAKAVKATIEELTEIGTTAAAKGASRAASKKSAPVSGGRDGSGIKANKPFAAVKNERATRDGSGVRMDKPFAPKQHN